MYSKWFDPNKSFLSLGAVWAVIGSLTGIAALISVVIIVKSSLLWDFSYLGFNNFIVIFKVPLGVLALIIPLVALLAANHRSEQTKEQIRITGMQNGFSNYYKHQEEFDNWIVDLKLDGLKSSREIHKKIFPNSRDGDYAIANEFIKVMTYLNIFFDRVKELYEKEAELSDDEVEVLGANLYKTIHLIYDSENFPELNVKNIHGGFGLVYHEAEKNNPRYKLKSRKVLDDIHAVGLVLHKICMFEHSFEPILNLEEIYSLKSSIKLKKQSVRKLILN